MQQSQLPCGCAFLTFLAYSTSVIKLKFVIRATWHLPQTRIHTLGHGLSCSSIFTCSCTQYQQLLTTGTTAMLLQAYPKLLDTFLLAFYGSLIPVAYTQTAWLLQWVNVLHHGTVAGFMWVSPLKHSTAKLCCWWDAVNQLTHAASHLSLAVGATQQGPGWLAMLRSSSNMLRWARSTTCLHLLF